MKRRVTRIVGWGLSVLISLFLIGVSGLPKFIDFEGKEKLFAELGWTVDTMKIVGVVEVALAVLFLVPRLGMLAAVLLTGYLGGATAAHVRVGEPFLFPVVLGVLVWVALGLRDRRVFALALGRPPRD